MAVDRNREKRSYSAIGQKWDIAYPNDVAGPFPYTVSVAKTYDQIKKKRTSGIGLTPPSPFSSLKISYKPPLFNQEYRRRGVLRGYLHNVPCSAGGENMGSPALGWGSLEGTDSSNVAKLLSNTNPFRYEISVPIMISELVEATSLLKLAVSNAFTLTGSAYLNWEFGWKLMLSDIRTLHSITASIESRIREFNSIVQTGGLRRKAFCTSGSTTDQSTGVPIYSAPSVSRYGTVRREYKTKVWGSVRWVPNRGKEVDILALANFNEACKTVLDLRFPDASTIWEAIPFSWLIDYFLNVGDALNAIEQTDLVLPKDICLMRHRKVTLITDGDPLVNTPGAINQWDESFVQGETVYDLKLRSVHTISGVSDLLSFGIMSKGQATNLFALILTLLKHRGLK